MRAAQSRLDRRLARPSLTDSRFGIFPTSGLQHPATSPADGNKDIVKIINPIVAISSKYHVRRPTRPFCFRVRLSHSRSQNLPDLAALITGAAIAVSLP